MDFFHCFFAVFYKDLLSEFRGKETINALFFFSVLIIFLFSLALGTDPSLLKRLAPGLLWLVVLFGAVLAFERSFQAEAEEGCLDRLVLYAASPRALFLGKLFTNFIFIAVVQIAVFFLMTILFGLKRPNNFLLLAATFFLGDLGVATLGTFYAALITRTKARQVMLPLMLFPMLTPLLLGAVYATESAIGGELLDQTGLWLRLLFIYDGVFLAACLVAVGPLLENI